MKRASLIELGSPRELHDLTPPGVRDHQEEDGLEEEL